MQWKRTSGIEGGRAGVGTIMEFWTLEGYAVDFLVVIVVVRNIIGYEEGSGPVLSGGYFEDACDGNLECVRPVEVDKMGDS